MLRLEPRAHRLDFKGRLKVTNIMKPNLLTRHTNGMTIQFGEVKHLTLLTSEECSGASKKHAVIVFVDSSSVDKLTSMTPVFAGDTLTVKRILPRILVELTTKINHCDIIHYLAGFGKISDITTPLDENNIQKKGYWFVTYESEVAVENILNKEKHFIKNIALNIEEAIFE
ncbi:RNA-binding protein squid-like [Leptinotarsa decemlineata]|uniref:RNA-binding protein squid-like n=1 Tax=Leptinotarsa decemlineata TaxID=7539 RepID=UPI003D30D313